jgi:hypothetical protein
MQHTTDLVVLFWVMAPCIILYVSTTVSEEHRVRSAELNRKGVRRSRQAAPDVYCCCSNRRCLGIRLRFKVRGADVPK